MLRRLFSRKAQPSRYYLEALAIISERGGMPDVELTQRLMMHDPVTSYVAQCAEDLALYRHARGIPVRAGRTDETFSAQLEAQFQHMLIDEIARAGNDRSEYATQLKAALIQRILGTRPTTK